jgi:putative ABC transport system permease protein
MMLFKIGWRNLFRNRRRTAASLLTVAFGAAGILIFQGFNEGIFKSYRENTIRVRYGHGEVFPRGYIEKKSQEPWRDWFENATDVEAKLGSTPGVRTVFPRVTFYAFLTKGGITLAGRGEGVLSEREAKFFSSLNFVEGTDLAYASDPANAIILGKGLAASLNARQGDVITVLGQTVNGQMNGLELTVSGIFHTGSNEFDSTFFRTQLSSAQMLLDTNRVEKFSLETAGTDVWAEVDRAIESAFPQAEARSFDELDSIYYGNAVNFLNSQFGFIRLIMLIIVGLGIFNTIATGLIERSGEVGALRANGESRVRVFSLLLIESALLGLLGGALGILLAVIVQHTVLAGGVQLPPGPGITRSFLIFLAILPSHYIQAIILPAVATIIASILPINRLVKKSIPALLRQNL